MRPFPFFAGILVGLAVLSWAGAHLRSAEWTSQFTRFHRIISPEADYFPTVRQIEQIIDDGPQGKVFVVVGGTSVFYGAGQPDQLMWTRQLQSRLGERFRVINFAQRGGWANETGDIAAEILLRRGARVIYAADGMPPAFAIPYSSGIYTDVVVQAWEDGYLIPWEPRDRLFRLHLGMRPDKFQSVILEMILDRLLHFNDLWNYFTFQIANLNWTPLVANSMFLARANYHDDETMLEAAHLYLYPDDIEMKNVRGWIIPEDSPAWQSITSNVATMIPPQLRRICLATVHLTSPRYLSRLSATERSAFVSTARKQAAELSRLGFAETAVSGVDYTETDYVDRIHMSASGGNKLAAMLAPKIAKLAQSLGYIQ